MQVSLSWTDFKAQVVYKEKVRFNDRDTFYLISYTDDGGIFETSIPKDSGADQTDFETNYKSLANKKVERQRDTDGRVINKVAAARPGWTYLLIPIEFSTAKLNSLDAKLVDGANRPGITIKYYNNSDAEVTDAQYENTIVKTVLDFEPSFDYEIIGGTVQQHTKPTTDIHLWVIAVPDVAEQYGGSKEMIGGVDLRFIDPADKINADGRASKYMTYSATYHTNKLRLVLKHAAGLQHELMLSFEIFRA
jgi:hypothetical protein